MALAYAEFDTTQANLLADLRTNILASTDWTRPNAAGKPDLYKCTTTRGADMIFDLTDAAIALNGMSMAVWRAHDGTTGTDKVSRWLYWRASTSGALATMPLHCIVSAGKEHIFISVEGPRGSEPAATNTVVGSLRNYFFMADLVPYHAADTQPVVVAGGTMLNSVAAHYVNNSHLVNISRNYDDSGSWAQAKLLSLDFPSVISTETITPQRMCQIDGNYYLFPYVVFSEDAGIRGRLNSFFFAGYTDTNTPEVSATAHGTKVTIGGQTYKMLAVSKSDSAQITWGQFGSANNSSNTTYHRSPVVAVPST